MLHQPFNHLPIQQPASFREGGVRQDGAGACQKGWAQTRLPILNDALGFKLQGAEVCTKRPFQLVTLRTQPEDFSMINKHASLSPDLLSLYVRLKNGLRGGVGIQLPTMPSIWPPWDSVSLHLE